MGCGGSKPPDVEAAPTKPPPAAEAAPTKPPAAAVAGHAQGEKSSFSDFQPKEVFDAPGAGASKDMPPAPKEGYQLVWVPDGSGQWVYVSPEGEKSVLIVSATGLKDADGFGFGTSDPYVVVRLGPVGSSWDSKLGEKRSGIDWQTLAPIWQFAFKVGCELEGNELHCRVFDKDLASDDPLGEVRIALSTLATHPDTLRDYALDTEGSLSVTTGDRVARELLAEAAAVVEADTAGWAAVAALQRQAGKLSQWFDESFVETGYYTTMISFALASGAKMKSASDGLTAWLSKKTTNKDGVDTKEWSGPIAVDCTTYTSHAEVTRRLASLGERLGTSHASAEVVRDNYLGWQKLNGRCWPEVPWHGIGPSMPQEPHAWIRPLFVKLVGPWGDWSAQWIEDEAERFFVGRRRLAVVSDVKVWCWQLLHRVLLDYDAPEHEVRELLALQWQWMKNMAIPDGVHDVGALKGLLGLDDFLAKKAAVLARYLPLILKKLPELAARPPEEQRWMASACMDAIFFAGGQSIPTVIAYALALPYSAWGHEHLPADFTLDRLDLLPQYVCEVLRRFPPVSGFSYRERSFGGADAQSVVLSIHSAMMDPAVWEAPESFVLRPMAEYAKKSVGFAEPSVAPRLGSPNSHACPGKDLGLAMAVGFLRGLARSTRYVDDKLVADPKRGKVAALWRLELPPKATQLDLSMYGPGEFALTRDSAVEGTPEAPDSGMDLLDDLAPEELAMVRKDGVALLRVDADARNLFARANAHTRFYTQMVAMMVKPGAARTSLDVGAELPPKRDFKEGDGSWVAPLGGLRFLKEDEDRGKPGRVSGLIKLLVKATTQHFEWDEEHEELLWFDSDAHAVACMDATFGPYLPPQFSSWEGLETDAVMAQLCVYGAAGWYLRGVRPEAEAGHAVPGGATLECSLEELAKYETRGHWVRYGGTAYLHCEASTEEAGMLTAPKLLAIWSCALGRLVAPGDEAWEHAKAAFRSSVCCAITCKDHLARLHWIIANGLGLAARETLGATHPLRRLTKQHYYGTAEINYASKESLMPLHQLAHRTFGLTDQAWLQFFTDVVAGWRWVPQPEAMAARGLPDGFVRAWPLARDGLAVWRVVETYVRAYLDVFYPTGDEALLGDAEVVAFWAHFETQCDAPWGLPPLSTDSLVSLLTDLIWWVTAGHELVGSIVEYLTTPHGLPTKLAPGATMPDVQSFGQALVIIALTGVRQPALLSDWTHLFAVDGWTAAQREGALAAVRQFQRDLIECAEEIDELNERRQRVPGGRRFVAFNPRIFETSVSI